ncbi:ROK family protein [Alicyclobacillus curvatus]|nr:ROK family protein [Alicyclobacillus curvatus]
MDEAVLGIDIGGTKALIGIGTMTGKVLCEKRLDVRQHGDAQSVIDAVVELARPIVDTYHPKAVGISTMGITLEDRVLLAPNVTGWEELILPSYFADAFPNRRISIANDVKAALLAEMRWGSLNTGRPVAYLNLGTGISLVFGNEGVVWDGAHKASGEIAYSWQQGERGYATGHAPLEESVGGGALDREAERLFGLSGGLQEVFNIWDSRPEVKRWMAAVLERIARVVGNVLLVLDVDRVAIGGGQVAQFEKIVRVFGSVWNEYLPFPPDIVPARFRHAAGLMGAIALGVDAL